MGIPEIGVAFRPDRQARSTVAGKPGCPWKGEFGSDGGGGQHMACQYEFDITEQAALELVDADQELISDIRALLDELATTLEEPLPPRLVVENADAFALTVEVDAESRCLRVRDYVVVH